MLRAAAMPMPTPTTAIHTTIQTDTHKQVLQRTTTMGCPPLVCPWGIPRLPWFGRRIIACTHWTGTCHLHSPGHTPPILHILSSIYLGSSLAVVVPGRARQSCGIAKRVGGEIDGSMYTCAAYAHTGRPAYSRCGSTGWELGGESRVNGQQVGLVRWMYVF
jgi:hypothetical protein